MHAVRQYLGRHSGAGGDVIALLDLKNAFNCVDRSAFREAIRRVAPRLAPWVDVQYGEPTPLFFGDTRLSSERGIQQGDPLGPALFSAAIHPIVEELRGHLLEAGLLELGLMAFYLDDGILAGDQETVAAAINFLESRFRDIGLELNRAKCELVPTAGRGHQVDLARFQGFEIKESGDFKLLGAAFGSSEYCSNLLNRRCVKAKHLLSQISDMGDAQTALLLTRNCAGFCKVAYSMRTVPPAAHLGALGDFGGLIRGALTQIAATEVDERGWTQAMLPMRAGGLGLRSVTDHAYAAYIASFRGASELAQRIDSAFDPEDAENFSGILDATRGLEARVRPDAAINLGAAGSKHKKGLACLLMPRQWPTSRSPRGETVCTCSTWRCRLFTGREHG